ncbi:hypothetical protein ACFVH6_29215 [Spirillospora sp. NPDC127200]
MGRTWLALAAAALAACSPAGPDGGCTAIGSPVGIGLDIAPADAARVSTAALRICWDGACRTAEPVLAPSGSAMPGDCDAGDPDAPCAASASPTGGKHGFADVPQLPETPVQVTVTLRDASGARLLERTATVTPKRTYPNGPDCGSGGPQAQLKVSGGLLRG